MKNNFNSSVCSPVPESCTIAKVASNKSLQGRQSRATQLLSAGTPATSWHGRQLPWQPRTPPTNQQPLGLPSFSSVSHRVQPGHCRGNQKTKEGVRTRKDQIRLDQKKKQTDLRLHQHLQNYSGFKNYAFRDQISPNAFTLHDK